jgi:hypothetical protein
MEDYYIALSPDFELNPAEFVAVWNEEEECRSAAVARLLTPASQQYDINLFAEIVLSLVTNIASSTVYDLIKKALTKREVPSKHIHIEALQKPDGTRFLVIDSEEK